jgi:hypothetical protein
MPSTWSVIVIVGSPTMENRNVRLESASGGLLWCLVLGPPDSGAASHVRSATGIEDCSYSVVGQVVYVASQLRRFWTISGRFS